MVLCDPSYPRPSFSHHHLGQYPPGFLSGPPSCRACLHCRASSPACSALGALRATSFLQFWVLLRWYLLGAVFPDHPPRHSLPQMSPLHLCCGEFSIHFLVHPHWSPQESSRREALVLCIHLCRGPALQAELWWKEVARDTLMSSFGFCVFPPHRPAPANREPATRGWALK